MVAHPDDDAYGVGGVVALHAADDGFRFILVHATDGEAGDIRPGFPATRETLGEVRRREDEAAWRAVGRVPDRHVWLGLPDGGLADLPAGALSTLVAEVLDEEQPSVVYTFGPDGIFDHPDHIAVGAATDEVFAARARATGPAFRRLIHGAVPESVFLRWNDQRAALGLPVFDPNRRYHMRGVPDAEIGLEVDCAPVAEQIVAGLREHRSQHHVMSDDADDVERWKRLVRRTWGVVAWPPRSPGESRLTDMLAGLP